MKVLVVDNIHLIKDEKGNYYSPSIYNYSFFKRYLNVFDELKIVAKVKNIDAIVPPNYMLINGPGIEVLELPWYQGIKGMILSLFKLLKIYRGSCAGCNCAIFRIAQVESFFVYLFGLPSNMPFAVEVVNDPNTFVDMPLLMRKFSVVMVKQMIKRAKGASYVTKQHLQKLYPVGNSKRYYFEASYSSIDLPESLISLDPLVYDPKDDFKIIHVSNAINTDIKGHYTVIKVVELLVRNGVQVNVRFVGDGSKVSEYKEYIQAKGLQNCIEFIGRVSDRDTLFSLLKSSNLMLLPTKMEGLPRTLIEAMAVGLPCLSSPTAGIPELLSQNYLFDPDDYRGFAKMIEHLTHTPEELLQMSIANIETAKQYTNEKLEPRRTCFYERLKNCC